MLILLISNPESIHTVRWANSLADRGHEVHIASLAAQRAERDQIDRRVTTHRLPAAGVAGYYLNAWALRRLVHSLRPDVSHAHYASGYGTLARVAGIPYLLSVWGSDVYEFPYRSKSSLRIIQRNLGQATAIASTSKCMADQVRRLLGDPSMSIAVTPFGVDLERFDPARVERGETSRFVVGNVKALAAPYGIDVLVRASRMLLDSLPDLPLRVVVYGDGPLRMELEHLVSKLGLDGVVRLPGAIAHGEVPLALSQLDVFCATSLRESFGVAVAEAMAMRRPVVASDAEGFVEVAGDSGLVVPAGNAAATAEALARLALDPALRARLAESGRARVEANYNWERNVDEMVQLYESLA